MIRIKTGIFVNAWLRRAQGEGAFAAIVHKGDEDAGLIAAKLFRPGHPVRVLMETRTIEGERAWRDLTKGGLEEAEADRLIARERNFDRDLWVIEIEDREGRSFLDEPEVS